MAEVAVDGPHGALPAHLAVPAGDGPWPGLVVVHELFGLNADIRRITDRFAAAGYVALAPDLFAEGGRIACMRAAFRQLSSGSGPMFDDIAAARSALIERTDCTGAVGVVGFCLGGGFALLAAPQGFAASNVNYGQVPKEAESLLRGACPIIASYGARDRGLRGQDRRLHAVLTELRVEHEVKTYPDAGHSFINQHSGPLHLLLGKVVGAGYHGPSAEDAWLRILAFFAKHLGKE